ncbi:hypothetical protein PVAND_002139 [Polypedilum vanderplanki]|uniref:Protein LTV1 homolog n=1 Tax=Polypedilum vanderplanki TaxID=319348 RepID=A0A9J6BQD8_POLVA|nr:hypothetical protein PVAND_002139 [Polypedilum vanderplanki]
MGRKKRPFIDKKKAITFRLVNRSQQDPLIVDEKAPQHVLVPVNNKRGDEPSTSKSSSELNLPPEKRRKEQQKYGVFFDDDYDYLQHLREPGKNNVYWEEVPQRNEKIKPKIQLPSSVFASEFEENEGMLNKAAPRPGPRLDWDPEVVAALDDDFDYDNPDNELEDNFIELATGQGEEEYEYDEEDEEYRSDDAEFSDEDENDELGPLPNNRGFPKFNDEETKSRFTEYSMSSSVIRRNEQLTLLDDQFEKFYENYDDDEVGALDCEEIEGHIDIDDNMYKNLSEDFKKKELPLQYEKSWDICRMVKAQQEEEEKPEEMVLLEVSDDENKKTFDCESILSNYSNIYNHPKLIDVPSKKKLNKIQINPKTGIPKNVLDNDQSGKLTEKSLAKLNNESISAAGGPKSLCAESVLSTLSVLSIRPKDETPEEKRERKKLLKEYRNERRIEKKANKLAFNEERLRQNAITMNNKNNLQGNKIL